MTLIRRDECEKCGSDIDSLARPGECLDDRCRGQMVVVEYVAAKRLHGAVAAFQEARELLYTRSGTPRRGTLPAIKRIDAAIDALIGLHDEGGQG